MMTEAASAMFEMPQTPISMVKNVRDALYGGFFFNRSFYTEENLSTLINASHISTRSENDSYFYMAATKIHLSPTSLNPNLEQDHFDGRFSCDLSCSPEHCRLIFLLTFLYGHPTLTFDVLNEMFDFKLSLKPRTMGDLRGLRSSAREDINQLRLSSYHKFGGRKVFLPLEICDYKGELYFKLDYDGCMINFYVKMEKK
jgi:hypothetical protein